jgi:hypothetical protein
MTSMKNARFASLVTGVLVLTAIGLAALPGRADLLVGTNGERFVGILIQETSTNVVFDSELGGRLTFPLAKLREIHQTSPAEMTNVALAAGAPANTPATQISTNDISWKPPGVGHDGDDWVQFKSGEWLRGQMKYIQNKKVEFDSDELDQQTLDLKDVSQVIPAKPVFTQFKGRDPAYGDAVISNNLVIVNGLEPLSLPRDQLIGITPSGGLTGIRYWTGDFTVGMIFQSGNNSQTTVNTSAELARRTPNTTLTFDYLGNYSQVDNVESANNQRVNVTYDIRLARNFSDWIVRPVQFEYYHDSLANISYRLTEGVAVGYYIFDRTGLKWIVSAGPAYQYTRFDTVETNQADTVTSPAGVLNSNFKMDITDRLTVIQTWQGTFSSEESGQYTHHAVTTLEFEIKRHLNLDVSFIWDYLQNPQPKSDGTIPQKSDTYLTVGLGVRF